MKKPNLKIIFLLVLVTCSIYAGILHSTYNSINDSIILEPDDILEGPSSSDVYYEDTTGYCIGVEVDGDIAFLACGASGMAVMNISNPVNPTAPTYLSGIGWAYDLDVSGDYAYIATGINGLRIADISTPAGGWSHVYEDTSGTSYDVQVSGNYAYIADGLSGLAVINISNPFSPGTPEYENTAGDARSLFVRGDYAYIADKGAGFAVIDISDPTNPGTLATETTNGDALGVWVEGDYAYVATSSGLNIINITDPTNPDYLTMISTDGYSSRVTIDGNYAYIADGIAGLAIINITDPLNPSNLVYEDTDGFMNDVLISGNYAYCADNSTGLAVIDISHNLIDPELVAYESTSGYAIDIDVEGDYAYLACQSSGLAIIDISDPENPGTPIYAAITDSDCTGVDVYGDYAYTSDAYHGLLVFDVSDPTSPTFVSNYSTTGYAIDIFIEGNYAFVAADTAGLGVFDISDPSNPGAPAYCATTNARDVTVRGDFAYLACYNYLGVVDISDPTSLGTWMPSNSFTGGVAQDVDVAGDFAFLACGDAGLAVVDISDPTTTGSATYGDTTDNARGVFVSGDSAFLGDRYDGLSIHSIVNPATPGGPVYEDTSGRGYDVQVHGDYAFVADYDYGLAVIKVRERTDRYDPIITDSPSDFGAVYGYSGQSISWTAWDHTNKTYSIVLTGGGTVVSNTNWSRGAPIIYNIPDGFDVGSYTYTVNFTDSDGHFATDSVTFTVDAPDLPLIIDSPSNITIEVGYSTGPTLSWTAIDNETYSYSIFLMGTGTIGSPNTWISGSPSTYTIPLGLGAGLYEYKMLFEDYDSNILFSDAVGVTVEDTSDPVITQIAINVTAEEGYTGKQFSWTVTDASPDSYVIELEGTGQVTGPSSWTSGDPIVYNIIEGLGEGYHNFTITLNDTIGLFTKHTVWLVVTPDVSDPVFTVTPSDITVEEGYTSQSFSWTATDANPDTYTLELVGTGIIAGPNTFTSGVQVTHYIADGFDPGVYTYNITVTDDNGRFASVLVIFTVTERPPEPPPKIPYGNVFIPIAGVTIIGLVIITSHRLKRKYE